jgi:hypothetical protein
MLHIFHLSKASFRKREHNCKIDSLSHPCFARLLRLLRLAYNSIISEFVRVSDFNHMSPTTIHIATRLSDIIKIDDVFHWCK